jgi:hypothetical protein
MNQEFVEVAMLKSSQGEPSLIARATLKAFSKGNSILKRKPKHHKHNPTQKTHKNIHLPPTNPKLLS